MGTLKEWLKVLFFLAIVGGGMSWLNLPIEADERKKLRSYSIAAFGLGGLLVGLMSTFGSRLFRWPLVIIMIPAVIAFVIAVANRTKQIMLMKAGESSS